MALDRFNLVDWVRCPAADEEGFRCVLRPSHDGGHVWGRCEDVDAEGHRCILPPLHPGKHWLAWFDRPAAPGETHRFGYAGTRSATDRRADADEHIFSAHGWVPVSRTFRPRFAWRWPPLAGWLSWLALPRGELTVVYEFRPRVLPHRRVSSRALRNSEPPPDGDAYH